MGFADRWIAGERRRSRSGLTLLVTLVALALAAGLGAVAMRQRATGQDVARLANLQLQAAWLAEAGLERAAAQRRARPDFTGDEWRIAPGEWELDAAALVRSQWKNGQWSISAVFPANVNVYVTVEKTAPMP